MDGPAHISLTLPLPPSANRLHRRGRDSTGAVVMHKSGEYRDWIKRAGQLALIQVAGDAVPYRYAMRIVLPETRKDADNYIKPIGDLLQKAHVITNDKHLCRLLVEVNRAREADTMLVELWALPDAAPVQRPRKPRATASNDPAKLCTPAPRMVRARLGKRTLLIPADRVRA